MNPFLPGWEYIPDVEPRVFGDRLYIYGSHDRFGGQGYCENEYVVWSAPLSDLTEWRMSPHRYFLEDDPSNTDKTQKGFAPDVVQGPDGRYYLYYCLSGTRQVSVAVSDSPDGPFTYLDLIREIDGTPYGGRPGSVFAFDPGILQDDDGTQWLYLGSAPVGDWRKRLEPTGMLIDGGYCVRMRDMLTMEGETTLVLPGPCVAEGTGFEQHAFFEAISPRKIGGRYYLLYSSVLSHELCWAASDRPDGGFRFGGTVVSIGDVGLSPEPLNYLGNTHGGMAQINGQWYVFYHRQTNLCQFARQCCAEPVHFDAEGNILQSPLTSGGLEGVLPADGPHEARTACHLSSYKGTCVYSSRQPQPQMEDCHPYFTQSGSDRELLGDQHIARLSDGAWACFRWYAFTGAESSITLWARGAFEGTVQISLARGGDPVASVPVHPSADWQPFSGELSVPAGQHALYLTWQGTGHGDLTAFVIN